MLRVWLKRDSLKAWCSATCSSRCEETVGTPYYAWDQTTFFSFSLFPSLYVHYTLFTNCCKSYHPLAPNETP